MTAVVRYKLMQKSQSKKKNTAYELNIIWVGDKSMPDAQLENTDIIMNSHSEAAINLWVIPELLNKDMVSKIKSRKNINVKNIKYILNENTCPKTYETVQMLIAAKQWASVSDVIRFLVLTRQLEAGQQSKRFYIEPDNQYPDSKNLKQMIRDKGFLFHSDDGRSARCDSLFIDIEHLVGKEFKRRLPTTLELVLGDHIVHGMLKKIFASENYKPTAYDIIFTTGSLNTTLIKLVMLRDNNFFKKSTQSGFSQVGVHSNMSWVPNTRGRLPECIETAICTTRFIEMLENSIVISKPKYEKYEFSKLYIKDNIKSLHKKSYYHAGIRNFYVGHTHFPSSSNDLYKNYPDKDHILASSKYITPIFKSKPKQNKVLSWCDIATGVIVGGVAIMTANSVNNKFFS